MARKITRFGLGIGGSLDTRGAARTPRPANRSKVGRGWQAQLGLLTARRIFYTIAIFFTLLRSLSAAQIPDTNPWQAVPSFSRNSLASQADIHPDAFVAFNLDHPRLHGLLNSAPKESIRSAASSSAVLTLPMPDRKLKKFRFVEAPVMAAELATQFPEIKTFVGQGIDDPSETVRFDLIPSGFHAQILSPNGAVYIDPRILLGQLFHRGHLVGQRVVAHVSEVGIMKLLGAPGRTHSIDLHDNEAQLCEGLRIAA